MARTQAQTGVQTRPDRGGSAPWVVFTAFLVVAMIAGLAALLIAMQPSGNDQTNGLGALHAPSLPAYKMPPIPPLPSR